MIQMMNYVAPGLNTSRQNLWEPITLRGLSPDHSLILVNGTRYHNSAYINSGSVRGMLGRGAVSNDLNSIPISAIERVEILRDGATALYGSDAIGGVLNIILKKSTGKTLNAYITEIRMEKAKELLKDSRFKLYEVANQLGYKDANYFSTLFKRYTGCTPSKFMEKYYL